MGETLWTYVPSCMLVLGSFAVLAAGMLRHRRYRLEWAERFDDFAKLFGLLKFIAPQKRPWREIFLKDLVSTIIFMGFIVLAWNAGVDSAYQANWVTFATIVVVWQSTKLLRNHYDADMRFVNWLVEINLKAARRLRQ